MPFTICLSLLLALDSARFEFKLKMRLNRRMPERPNICYIFEKLRVQGCQIWHSHVPIPLNSAPQCKKALTLSFQPKILKISFTKVAGANIKSYAPADFLFPLSSGRRGHRAALSSTWNTLFFHFSNWKSPKESDRVMWGHFHERVDESPQKDENFGTSRYPISFSFGRLKLKFLCELFSPL